MVTLCTQLEGCGDLDKLSELEIESTIEALRFLSGVGPKVADCFCLFSLGKHHVVTLDVRVARLHGKTMSPAQYEALKEWFQGQYGGRGDELAEGV